MNSLIGRIASILFIAVSFPASINAQDSKKYCDSLIKVGTLLSGKDELKALSILTKAQTMAKKNKWMGHLSNATNNIGVCYYNLMDYNEALKYYREAYTIAKEENNSQYQMMALNNIAAIYGKEKDTDKAAAYFQKAYEVAKKAKDTMYISAYSLNLGIAAQEKGEYKEARQFYERALKYSKKIPHLKTIILTAIAENDLEQGNTQKARANAIQLYSGMKEKKGSQTAVTQVLIVAKSYFNEGNYEQAERYAKTGLSLNPEADLETEKTIYEILADTYTARKLYKEAVILKDSVLALEKRLTIIKNGRELEQNKVKFEIQEYKNEIELKEATIATERRLFYSIAGGMAAVLLLIIVVLRNRVMKHREKKLIAENNHKELALQLALQESEALLKEKQFHEKQHEILLEQEKLKNEIEYKNRKLSSKALHASGKYQMIEDVIGMLSNEAEVVKLPAVQKHIRYLRNSLHANDEWEGFLIHFEEVNQGFLTRLKNLHPNLNANDIRFICYVYMNLNAKEIAAMLNISQDAGRKRKERVAQKIGLQDSTSLYAYLSGI